MLNVVQQRREDEGFREDELSIVREESPEDDGDGGRQEEGQGEQHVVAAHQGQKETPLGRPFPFSIITPIRDQMQKMEQVDQGGSEEEGAERDETPRREHSHHQSDGQQAQPFEPHEGIQNDH